ncbi:unnamed protein product [Candida verbasci]|uniref:Actin patches distal protein 1 n=1 Tax=Candida verbasci TaxID=1227364 RepID=A0A9W4TXW4_9ASCO|nr:unnamed protein product [Candida verbasci]
MFNKIFGKKSDSIIEEQIKDQGFEISTCPETCDACITNFPKSLKFEEDEPLYNSTKPFGLHLLISTGKTDWPHDATGTPNTLSNAIADWASKKKSKLGNIKVTVSSLGSDELLIDDEYINGKMGDVLIMPYFLWIKKVKIEDVAEIFDKLNQYLENHTPVDDIEIPNCSIDNNSSYIFLCSHKTRDKKCGITAPIMKKEMDLYLRELELYRDFGDNRPNGVQVAFLNHIGGHKFAANVIIYNKESMKNIWLALCRPNNVKPIIDECVLQNRVFPNKVRIVQNFNW